MNTEKPKATLWDLPEELDMGEQPFRVAQDDNTAITAIHLPKRDEWVFTDPRDLGTYKIFIRLTEEIGASKDPKGVLVDFLKACKKRKEQNEQES
jgi:hypothetical protein